MVMSSPSPVKLMQGADYRRNGAAESTAGWPEVRRDRLIKRIDAFDQKHSFV
jgi:hypothetical protein